MKSLQDYRKNVFSQNGEDGVIEEICRRMSIVQGEFVEFGAWDGKHLSNTFNLLSKGNGWKGVYIEGDTNKFNDLKKMQSDYVGSLDILCAYVESDGENTLDNLLARTNISLNFDLLSIDIDSFDWHVWYSFKKYNPKIVVIEINSSIPPGVFQTHRDSDVIGSSFSATLSLGMAKGYTLVCHTGNMFFVRNDLSESVGLKQIELDFPEILFDYTWCLSKRVMNYFSPEKPKGFLKRLKNKIRTKKLFLY